MSIYRVAEAKYEHGFARLVEKGTQEEFTADLIVLGPHGSPLRLRPGDQVTGCANNRRLVELQIVSAADPPSELVAATEAIVAALQHHGLVVPMSAPEITAKEWHQDLRISSFTGDVATLHPILIQVVQRQLTFLIDWNGQGYVDQSIEHPFDDASLCSRLRATMLSHVPEFQCESHGEGYRIGPPSQWVPFGDWDWTHPHPCMVALTSISNDMLSSSGSAQRWVDTDEDDWILCTSDLAQLLKEHHLLIRI